MASISPELHLSKGRHESRRRGDNLSSARKKSPFRENVRSGGEGKSEDGKDGDSDINDNESVGTFHDFLPDQVENIDAVVVSKIANDFIDTNKGEARGECKVTKNSAENINDTGGMDKRSESTTATCETTTVGNVQHRASSHTLHEDDQDFDGGGKLGGSSNGDNNLPDPNDAERREDSNSIIGKGSNRKRKAEKLTSPSSETKKPKGTGKDKDQKSSEAATRREFDKFKRWLPLQPEGIPTEWSNTTIVPDKIEGDGGKKFIQFGTRMIAKARGTGMKDHHASRLQHVLDNSSGKTYAELYHSTVMCFVPIKGGTRKTKYEIRHCKVCKAKGELIDQSDHNCPYCLDCFNESGWKKNKIILVENCTRKHNALNEL